MGAHSPVYSPCGQRRNRGGIFGKGTVFKGGCVGFDIYLGRRRSVLTANRFDAAGSISRLLYGVAAENGSGSSIFAIFAFNALASLLGIMIALLIGLINTVKIKRLIDSLEVKKSE